MPQTLVQGLLDLVRDFLAPLDAAAASDQARQSLFDSLGHTATISAHPAVVQVLRGAAALLASLSSLDELQLHSWEGVQKALALVKQAETLIDGLKLAANQPALEEVAAKLAEEMGSLLLSSWLRRRHEKVHSRRSRS